ncbi:MAG TPA: amidohydrolase family protein [Pyrinomonadaceae bacterium]
MRRAHTRTPLAVFVLLASLLLQGAARGRVVTPPQGSSPAEVVERGKFRIYKLQYPVGEESYEIAREGGAHVLSAKFEINYLGDKVPLTATLRTRSADLAPLRFEIKGRTSTRSEANAAVEVGEGGAATVREGTKTRTEQAAGARIFPSGGLLPVSLQQALFQYAARHGALRNLRTLPVGRVSFEPRGDEQVEAGGRRVGLTRYSVSGLVWGRETAWFDEGRRLIALISPDAELDRLEAVREGYEHLLPLFVARAAADSVADLRKISDAVRPLRAGRYAIVGATLIDGTGTPPVADAVVLVENGRITAAGPRASVKIPKGVNVFDARGKYLLPGLWDMHAHAEQGEWIPASLAAGITTMRDAGNEPEFILPLRDALRAGKVAGPRLLLAGIIDSPPGALGNNVAETPEAARAIVGRYKRDGYEQVKIYQSLKPELVSVVAAEAHRLGMSVTGHVPTGVDAYAAVEAGMDQINHVGFILRAMRGRGWRPTPGTPPPPLNLDSPEAAAAIKFFKERGTVIDPTLARGELNGHALDMPFVNFEPGMAKTPEELASILNNTGLPPEVAPRAAASAALAARLTVMLMRAGVPVVAGTDLVVPGHTIYRELELYVRAGMTPAEALQTATIIPARVMRLDKELGTIERGKFADMILVDADPLADISNLRRVRYVVTGGRLYESAPLWRSVGFRP